MIIQTGKAFFVFTVAGTSASCGIAAAKEILAAETPHYAFVGHPQRGLAWSDERGNAFIGAIRLHNLPCSRFETPRGKVLRKTALRDWLLALPKPCGIFAANDFTADELIAVGNSIGINFTRDVRIISFDNDEQICLRARPTISSLWPDYERAGFLCAEGGVATASILLNVNDAPGDYHLVCRDRASGLVAERNVQLLDTSK